MSSISNNTWNRVPALPGDYIEENRGPDLTPAISLLMDHLTSMSFIPLLPDFTLCSNHRKTQHLIYCLQIHISSTGVILFIQL